MAVGKAEGRRLHRGLRMPDLKLLVTVRHGRRSCAAQAPPQEGKRGGPVYAAESMRKLGLACHPNPPAGLGDCSEDTVPTAGGGARRIGTLGLQSSLLDGAE